MFFRFGFHRVSVDQIVGELGISKKTFYRSFESKERVLEDVLVLHMRRIEDHLSQVINDAAMPLEDKLHSVMEFIRMHMSRINVVFLQDLKKYQPRLYARVDDFRKERIMKDFKRLFQEGVESGIFRTDVDPQIFVLAYSNMVQQLINPDTLSSVSFTAEEVYRMILRIVLEGVMTENGRQRHGRTVQQARD